ncbi:uncharacterized protein PODANS_1_5027 [Podospora anserina S mat+]|uniref:Podospora anserina S mat+ genomic DNA chromosome 1, supercontig 1 n=1 Tax=Podospora anserina (strain S / ATCC MYA-4624 / DSM 980 / FGSC 10383) TaxID=515849 RepID=B2AAS9_PODAN|nr:uncharacterized protein PODANS_1_5027 [Podospora anserina S mat+]CAP60191.1 unnamed protein product [Podospora anserina S mat+]CDP22831.1 Putative protein of unknown function [Podospora anserina S mat+]
MSCQTVLLHTERRSQIHILVERLCMALKMCVQAGNHEQYRIPYLNNDAYPVDLAEVSNLIYWMARIQSHLGLGPRGFGRRNHQLLPSHVALPAIESATKARRLALNNMHENYANAEYTIIHDTDLVNFPWSDDGSPCITMILSTWFTRGWTALELFMSKRVLVLSKTQLGILNH